MTPLAGGSDLYRLVEQLFPFCRSITGDGVRQTLATVSEVVDLDVVEVPTGTSAYDWDVPREWNIRDAWVKDPSGQKVVDFHESNLQVVSYSAPVHTRMPLAELEPHLHTLPEQPSLIPYRTSYYNETWGFCLPHDRLVALPQGDYEVFIDSELRDGSLTYGEVFLPGEVDDEILFSCHVCHPSLANDNLSGMAVAAYLARWLSDRPRRHSFRFLFGPGTIGSLVWLSRHEEAVGRIRHGLVLSCLGDSGGFTYKRSRRGDTVIDRAVEHLLAQDPQPHQVQDFSPYGYDERQFCSPGFNLAVGLLTRSPHGSFPEYHTSADNLDFVSPPALEGSLTLCASIVTLLEREAVYVNQSPMGEPRLGKRGLYRGMGGSPDQPTSELALLWVLNQSDGLHSLLDIAERARLPFDLVAGAADALEKVGLLAKAV